MSIIWYPNPNHDSTLGMILCAQTILTLPIYICICRYDAAAAHYGTRGSLHSLNSRPTLTAADGCRSDYSTDGSSYQEGAVLNPMMQHADNVKSAATTAARVEASKAGANRPPPAFAGALEAMVKKRQISVTEEL